jgi:hypothetical protein
MARRRVVEPPRAAVGAYPPELRSRLLPFWSSMDNIVEKFGQYVTDEEAAGIFCCRPSALYHRVLGRWAVANGFASHADPRFPDWRALRVAGVINSAD